MVALFLLILFLLSILAVCIKYHLFSKNAASIAHIAAHRPVEVSHEQRATPAVALPTNGNVSRSQQVLFNQAPIDQSRGTNWDSNRRSYIK